MGSRAADAAPAIAEFLFGGESLRQERSLVSIGVVGGPGSISLSLKGVASLALARMGKAAAAVLPAVDEALTQFGDQLGSVNQRRPLNDPRLAGSVVSSTARRDLLRKSVTSRDLLTAAQWRLANRPAPEPNSKPIDVKLEHFYFIDSVMKLLLTEHALFEESYGTGAERC